MGQSSLIDVNDSVLIVIDVQDFFLRQTADGQGFLEKINWIIDVAVRLGVPIIATAENIPEFGTIPPGRIAGGEGRRRRLERHVGARDKKAVRQRRALHRAVPATAKCPSLTSFLPLFPGTANASAATGGRAPFQQVPFQFNGVDGFPLVEILDQALSRRLPHLAGRQVHDAERRLDVR